MLLHRILEDASACRASVVSRLYMVSGGVKRTV